ncbi:S9 family peptidase [Salinibacterium sp. SYSU T00001]|uniref:S9 family peptidase n=1 Tax=Homoserinimonas sedimenticola TaxID=2986805 RepID=UPI0022362A6D|nr:S9 family peptidase [Salinibacterium sedimenticola]MCW4386208.1 S9 family peptidase [Salinibacterium sedimenticola]
MNAADTRAEASAPLSKTPPVAARKPIERTHHGDTFVDQYEWLREKESPEVVAHLEAENAHTDAATAHLAELREQLFQEIKGRVKETDLGVPVREGDWWYYSRTVEGQQYAIHCRAPIADPQDWSTPQLPEDGSGLPDEQVLLDSNAEAEGSEFFALGSFDVSADGTLMLWGVDRVGDERYAVRVRPLANDDSGDSHPDPAEIDAPIDTPAPPPEETIEGTAPGAFFDATGRYIFYTTVDDAWRPDTVWRHEVGTPASEDVKVFHEPDERYWVGAGLTRSRRYIVIELGSKITSEAHILDADDPTGEFRVVWPRREGVEYSIEHAVLGGEDRLLVLHNDGALDFELADVAASDPLGERRVLVPHRPGIRLEDVDAFASHLVLEYRREALPRLAVARLDGDPAFTELEFDEELFAVGATGNPEWEQPTVRIGYTSFVTPSTVSDYTVATGDVRVLKQQPVQGGYDPADYVQRREWATAEDGTRVPISLVHRRDVTPENAPTLLYGYGSYEHSIDPGFSIARVSLLDRGVVFAVAHVRGGGEMGRDWYEHGKTLTKRNTFTDFVACAQHLVDTGVTSPEKLIAEGGSAGGLLMGAVANLAPTLFAGILAAVPFVDPLTSILDPELPLTVVEWDEWGNPLGDPQVYAYMKSYAPYENVTDAAYPRILAVTSFNDTRVLYVEPAKWVARLREVGAPVLLKIEMEAGHGGVSGRYKAWQERAWELAWMLDVWGLA